jgi:hypothetical protein
MPTPQFSKPVRAVWWVLHVCTLALPTVALFAQARWVDIFLPVCSNLVVNFAPSWMLNRVIKPNLNLAKDYADAAGQAERSRGGTETEIQCASNAARFKHENEQEIVGHLCITIIGLFGLLSSAFVLNVAYMITPAQVTVTAPSILPELTNIPSTNLTGSPVQATPPSSSSSSWRRAVGISTVLATLLFSAVCLFHMGWRTDAFVGRDRYMRQEVGDYFCWISPPSIRCPMTVYRLIMTLLNSTLPVIKYFCVN